MLDDPEVPKEKQLLDLVLLKDLMEGINVFIDYIKLKDRYKLNLARSRSSRAISPQKKNH